MNSFFQESLFAGVTISLLAYLAGSFLKKKFKLGILNPLLISIVITILVLVVADVDYDTYDAGAKDLSWFLTPATVCLAIPLYEQWQLLKRHWRAVLLGILAGVFTSMGTVFVLSLLLGLSHQEYVTLLPKSITTAIGMGLSEELGGYVTITVAVIVVTGVLGNIMGEAICKIFRSICACHWYSQGNGTRRGRRCHEQSCHCSHRSAYRGIFIGICRIIIGGKTYDYNISARVRLSGRFDRTGTCKNVSTPVL